MLAFALWLPPALAATDARHEGVATCASSACHGRAQQVAAGRVPLNEYVTWASFDPHAGAFATLRNERSRTMARRLGIARADAAPECLSCHADDVPPARRGVRFQPDDGIGCEACHGGAERWLATHDDTPRVSHADNLAAGMTALEDPAVRGPLCAACHVGEAGNRFASHRLMAAGHPRLAFELDTFTELWRTSGGREHYRPDADYRERKAVATPLATWSQGLVSGATSAVTLIRDRYAAGGRLPDFALFNCYSCHRAMGQDDWAGRTNPVAGEPGALRFDNSSLVMLEAAFAARPERARALARAAEALQAAASQGPAAVRPAAGALLRQLADLGAELRRRPLAADESRQALAALRRQALAGAYPDYVHAEQAAMGLVVLLDAAGQKPDAAVDALFQALEDDDRYDPARFRRALGRP
jgi:hypothetical protein